MALSWSGRLSRTIAERPVGFDHDLVGQVVGGHEVGSLRMRVATRLRWICDVPPMTLWARL